MTDREIFMNAPADATPEVLAAYLDKACGGDEELRARVELWLDDPDVCARIPSSGPWCRLTVKTHDRST